MDYLKWQLRADFTDEGYKAGGDTEKRLEEYTNKARGWNKCKEKILEILESDDQS